MNFIYELGGTGACPPVYLCASAVRQGYYKWIDQNHNGIQELNEFVPSQFNDSAQYVRVQTALNDYVRSNSTGYTQNITIQPKAVWFNQKDLKGLWQN